jgi:hypothetical protein
MPSKNRAHRFRTASCGRPRPQSLEGSNATESAWFPRNWARGSRERMRQGAAAFARPTRAPRARTRRLPQTTRERAVRARADDRNRGRKRAQTGGHGRTSLDRRAWPSEPLPHTGTSLRACARFESTTGRRRPPPRNPAARSRRPAGGANGRPQPAAGAPSSPTRRPDRLAHRIARAGGRMGRDGLGRPVTRLDVTSRLDRRGETSSCRCRTSLMPQFPSF